MADVPSYRAHDSALIVTTCVNPVPADRRREKWGPGFRSPDWETYNRLKDCLRGLGFSFRKEAKYRKGGQFASLGRFHDLGSAGTPAGDIFVECECFPVGCKFTFFQEINVSNRHGGRHDFDRLARMPYLIRKKFEGSVRAAVRHLEARGFADHSRIPPVGPLPSIGRRIPTPDGPGHPVTSSDISAALLPGFNDCWNMESDRRRGTDRFKRDASGWPADSELCVYSRKSGDGSVVRHGETRHFRDRKGYLRRGTVFGGINGMWTVFASADEVHHLPSSALFFCEHPAGLPRKIHPRPRSLEDVLKKAIENQNFERAIVLRDLIASRRLAA